MKKLALSVIIAGMFAFVACGPKGPTPEEQQKIQDSIAQAKADSVKNDSIAQATALKAKEDSIKKADSIAKIKPEPKKKEVKKGKSCTTTP